MWEIVEVLLGKVGDSNEVNISEAVDPKQYKVNEVKETENKWNQKRMHGQYMSYVKEKEELGSGLQNIRAYMGLDLVPYSSKGTHSILKQFFSYGAL